jgi:hypothetical protein
MNQASNVPQARRADDLKQSFGNGLAHVREDLLRETPQSVSWSIFTVMTYTVVALGVYAYASYELRSEARPLEERCEALELKRQNARRAVRDLSQTVASLSDPAADEYALITELGRIPEGSRKMLLTPPPSS